MTVIWSHLLVCNMALCLIVYAIAGDVQFEFRRAHDGFSSLELGLHTTFMFVSCGVLAAVLWGLKRFPTDEWSWEQRALVLLLFGILALNSKYI